MRAAITHWLTTRNRWQSSLLLFVVGALMTLGFAPYHLSLTIFVALPLLYVVLTASISFGQALWRSFMFGYGYAMAGTWWISNALLVDADKFGWMVPFSVLGLSAVMALWFVVFGGLVYRLRARMNITLFVVLWVLIEYFRSVGIFGFPWNLVGYMSLVSLPFAQVASLIGTYGLSYIILLVGLTPVYWLGHAPMRRKCVATASAVLLVASCYAYGAYRLQTPVEMSGTTLRLVQPSIPQKVKGTRDGEALSIETLGKLTNTPTVDGTLPDMTIWPETAYPFTVRAGQVQALPKVKLLLAGAVRAEGYKPNVKIWNSLVAVQANGTIIATYDKHQLVPFGEFVPLRDLLPLEKITPGDLDFSRGVGPSTLNIAGIPSFSPQICYEGIFPWLAIDHAHRPEWLLNITNDGWYGDSAGPYQHFDMARMRAIEQGLPLVRAANSGISAVIDPYGRIIAALHLNQRAILDASLPKYLPSTPYSNYLN